MFYHIVKFIFGYLLGLLLWLVLVEPYKKYYDFTFGHYWPAWVFSFSVAILFLASLSARSTMTLFVPNMVGSATQNYIIVLLFTTLLLNPLTSLGFNSVESVRVIGCSLTLTFDQLSERAKLVLNPILEILSDENQTHLDPMRQDLVRIQQYIGEIRQNAQLVGGDASANQPTSGSVGGSTKKGVEYASTSKTGIQLEWETENFGLRANIDMERVRKLAKSGKLQQYLGQNLTANLNLTDVLYASCLNIFEEAKRQCSASVNDLHESCESHIGPYMATWWCAPFTYSLETFCPWIMGQLVDEKSLCKQIKTFDTSDKQPGVRLANNRTLDVNSAFRELNEQINHLNQHLLLDDTSAESAEPRQRARRLEVHLTFNEQTRQVFQTTKSVIEFISDKYKMRKLLINALLFAYDIYTTYTFLLIVAKAWRYRRDYLSSIRHDNCYITRNFIELDRGSKEPVLPLTKEESRRFITTFTCRRRTGEERQVHKLSLTVIIIFLAFTLSLFYLDNIFYSLLVSIHDRSLIHYKELGQHELDVQVRGDGIIARLVKRLVGPLNSVYNLDRLTSTRQCLPEARMTANWFYLEFACLVLLYFLIDQISIYAMRLRRTTCTLYYPEKERQRVQFLHKLIQFKRHRLAQSGAHEANDNKQIN